VPLLVLAAVFGGVSGIAFVAIYLGLAVGSLGLGPVITHQGYGVGFLAAGATSALGTIVAATLWRARPRLGLSGGAGALAGRRRADRSAGAPR
jgi:predicted MFS family arabinose efflux permease